MSSLTDRYVHAVLRHLPEEDREDVGRELRTTIADAVEAAGPETAPEAAERDVVATLGDPARLADGYRGKPTYLIGPDLYPVWRRVTLTLLGVVPGIAAVAGLVGDLADDPGQPVGSYLAGMLGAAFLTGIQIVFWTVLGFAVAEHRGTRADQLRRPWSPDDLTEPVERHVRWGEVVAQTAGIAAVLAVLAFLPRPSVTVDGRSVHVFTDVLWTWRWGLVGVLAVQLALGVAVGLRGRWTFPLAHANAALELLFAVPVLGLLWSGEVLDPAVLGALSGGNPAAWTTTAGVVVALSAAWGTIDTYRKAFRSR